MSFNDIFKSSFLQNVSAIEPLDMVLALALSFCVGLFIFYVYKKTYQGVMFSSTMSFPFCRSSTATSNPTGRAEAEAVP